MVYIRIFSTHPPTKGSRMQVSENHSSRPILCPEQAFLHRETGERKQVRTGKTKHSLRFADTTTQKSYWWARTMETCPVERWLGEIKHYTRSPEMTDFVQKMCHKFGMVCFLFHRSVNLFLQRPWSFWTWHQGELLNPRISLEKGFL